MAWYERKLERDFAKCKTVKQVQKKLAEYERANDYLDWGLTIGLGAATLGSFGALLYGGVYFPNMDKLGHMGKGFIASRATGGIFDRLYRWWHSDEIKDADDDVRANLRPTLPRAIAEGVSTAGTAYGWEVAQRDVPAWPGSAFDLDDMAADTGGHVLGSFVESYLSVRRAHQYGAASKRLQELGEKELPPVWEFGFAGAKKHV